MRTFKQWKAARLLESFNAASGVIAGLNKLKAETNGTFDYTVQHRRLSVVIETNIPASGYRSEEKVAVTSDGYKFRAMGDALPLGLGYIIPHTRTVNVADEGADKKVVNFVRRYAARNGMLK